MVGEIILKQEMRRLWANWKMIFIPWSGSEEVRSCGDLVFRCRSFLIMGLDSPPAARKLGLVL